MLQGQELIWLSDPFEAYIAHVQGSAKVRLPDGQIITVGYAATNGHEYASVAEQLVADGKIASDRISLATMIEYFKAHPDEVTTYIRANPRYVFFQSSEGTPRGSLNEPVTPWRTIATDKSIFPQGMPGVPFDNPAEGAGRPDVRSGPTTASSSTRTPAARSVRRAAVTSTWAKATRPGNWPGRPTRKAGSTTSSSNPSPPPRA